MDSAVETQESNHLENWSFQGTLQNGERFQIEALASLPFPVSSLPSEASQWINQDEKNQTYLCARDSRGNVLGFTVVQNSEGEHPSSVDFVYRYVFPEERRKGIGGVLRRETYEWARSQGIPKVISGIKDVLRIQANGVEANYNPEQDGNYISYTSMAKGTLRNGQYPLNSIQAVTVFGSHMDFNFETTLLDETRQPISSPTPTLPFEPGLLFAHVQKNVLPDNLSSPSALLQEYRKKGVVKFSQKQEVDLTAGLRIIPGKPL